MHTGCTEGTRNVKSKVNSSLASKFQEVYLRVPFHSIQTGTGSLHGIFSAKPQGNNAKVNVGVKTPETKTELNPFTQLAVPSAW